MKRTRIRMMTRIMAIVLALVVVLTLAAGCGGGGSDAPPEEFTGRSVSEPAPEALPEAEATVGDGTLITLDQEFDYMGMWRLTSVEHEGVTYTGENMGTDLAFRFSYYNNVEMIVNGESQNRRWAIQDGVIMADVGTLVYHFMPDGEKLVVSEEGYIMTFERDLGGSVHCAPWGSSKRLEGRALFVSVFVDLDDSGWSDEERVLAKEELKIAAEYIQDQGSEYGKDIEFIYDFEADPELRYDMRFEGSFHEERLDNNPRTTDEIHDGGETYKALAEFVEDNIPYAELARRYQTDSIVYVVHANKTARSYACVYELGNNNYAEMAVVFNDDRSSAVYAHEILHLFAAIDLYCALDDYYVSDELVEYANAQYPNEIMLVADFEDGRITGEISPLTALRLGWVSDIPELEQFPNIRSTIPASRTPRTAELNPNSGEEFEYEVVNGEARITNYLKLFERDPVLVIPDELDGYPVTCIGREAFQKYTELTDLTIPDSVKTLEINAFKECTNLTNVTIPAGVTSIEYNPFPDCASLTYIDVAPDNPAFMQKDGVLFDKSGKKLIAYPGGKMGAYTIPQGTTSIGYAAFSGSVGLKEVVIPEGITSTGDMSFWKCANMTKVTLPNSLTSINRWTFRYCSRLTDVNIPDSVTFIGEYAFADCYSLLSLTVPPSVVEYGKYWPFEKGVVTLTVTPGSYTESYAKEKGIAYVYK